MAVQRTGSPVAFWDDEATVSNGTGSTAVLVARWNEQIVIYAKTTEGASTFAVEVAHHGVLTDEGNEPDESEPPNDADFYPLTYILDDLVLTTNAAGKGTILVPDFEPAWVRIRALGTYTNVTAGYEITGE